MKKLYHTIQCHMIRNLLVYYYDTKFDSFNYSVMTGAAWKSNLPDDRRC